jgi:hypothetical protein
MKLAPHLALGVLLALGALPAFAGAGLLDDLKDTAEDVKDGIQDAAEDVQEGIQDSADGVKDTADDLKDKAEDLIDGQTRYDGKQTSLSKNLDFTSFIYLDRNGEPFSVGVELSGSDVLDPSTWVPSTNGDELNFWVDLPPEASITPFQVLGLAPQPIGHPGDLFGVPHFDVHFYMLSPLELRAAMPPQTCTYPGPDSPPSDNFFCAWAKGTEPPANSETNLPRSGAPWGAECPDCAAQALYTAEPCVGVPSRSTGYEPFVAVPYMGMHWVPSASEEYPDGPPGCEDAEDQINGWARTDPCFTHTPILGSYDGSLVFYEPMITSDFMSSLKKGTKECYSFAVPGDALYVRSGFYPSDYCVSRVDDDKFEISLESFTHETYAFDVAECESTPAKSEDAASTP